MSLGRGRDDGDKDRMAMKDSTSRDSQEGESKPLWEYPSILFRN